MKMSRRARRMAMHHRRHKRGGALNMVSLMDIFTILVFFLLVNVSEVELITPPASVELPESTARERPEKVPTVTVSPREILVDHQKLTRLSIAITGGEGPIPALIETLQNYRPSQDSPAGQRINVVADRRLEYNLIKRILQSCTAAGFEHIALAVLQAPEPRQ